MRAIAIMLVLLLAFADARELIVDDYSGTVKIKREYVSTAKDQDIYTDRYFRIFNTDDEQNPVFVFDTVLRRLGIGVTDPLYALHVFGDIFATGKVIGKEIEAERINTGEIKAGEVESSEICVNGECISSWGEVGGDKDPANELQTIYKTDGKICISGTGTCVEDERGTCKECDGRFVNVGEPAGGDLSGKFPYPTVVRIQGLPVSSKMPAVGDVLKWNGNKWVPSRDEAGRCYISGQCTYVSARGEATCPSGYVMTGLSVRSTPYCVKTYMSSCGNYMGYFCGVNSVTRIKCCRLVCN